MTTTKKPHTNNKSKNLSEGVGKALVSQGRAPLLAWTNVFNRLKQPDATQGDAGAIRLWQAALAEFVAAFLFIFLGCGAVVVTGQMTGGEMDVPRLILIAAVHGLGITALVYATLNVSGAHINPAVTITMWVTRQVSGTRALSYLASQLGGAALAPYCCWP